MTMHKTLKTGSDPRALPGYVALRDELSKLTHPARPDVNWPVVEKLSLSLFEQNGVELQTAAWYTLARTQLAGLDGLNEGLAILEALISHQWGRLWPQPVQVRMEILSSLSKRLQQQMRALTLNDSDLSQIISAEQRLIRLRDVLQRLEQQRPGQLDALQALMHHNAVRLQSSKAAQFPLAVTQPEGIVPVPKNNDVAASGNALPDEPVTVQNVPDSGAKRVYVVQSENHPDADVRPALHAAVNKVKFFIAGMFTMLVFGVAAGLGWLALQKTDPLQVKLAASLSPLPATLTPEQLDALRQQPVSAQPLIAQTRQQLTRLAQLPPDWNIDYSRQLLKQAQSLRPEQASALARAWQQMFRATALPTEKRDGWHQGMTALQQLSDKLNKLDEQKGRYMTVSELKSVVFSAMQAFNRSIPAEEQLRLLSRVPPDQALPAAAQVQLEMHLKQLIADYAAIKQRGSEREVRSGE